MSNVRPFITRDLCNAITRNACPEVYGLQQMLDEIYRRASAGHYFCDINNVCDEIVDELRRRDFMLRRRSSGDDDWRIIWHF